MWFHIENLAENVAAAVRFIRDDEWKCSVMDIAFANCPNPIWNRRWCVDCWRIAPVSIHRTTMGCVTFLALCYSTESFDRDTANGTLEMVAGECKISWTSTHDIDTKWRRKNESERRPRCIGRSQRSICPVCSNPINGKSYAIVFFDVKYEKLKINSLSRKKKWDANVPWCTANHIVNCREHCVRQSHANGPIAVTQYDGMCNRH